MVRFRAERAIEGFRLGQSSEGVLMIRGFSDHAANERTFLAWVRSGIAVIGFGFVIEKFRGLAPSRLLLLKSLRIEFQCAAILSNGPHCVFGHSVRHLSFNLKRDLDFGAYQRRQVGNHYDGVRA
jgi:hypothetical protein